MGRSFKWRRVLLESLDEWIVRGWRAAVAAGGAIGCVPVCGGELQEVLVVLEPDDSLSGGLEGTPAGWEG